MDPPLTIIRIPISPFIRASGIGPAAPVLAGPVFQDKIKILFSQKASNKQSASVILGIISLTILSYNR